MTSPNDDVTASRSTSRAGEVNTQGGDMVTRAGSEPSRWVEPNREAIDKNVDLYEITYYEARRSLDDQAAEVTTARTRAVQFLAFIGAGTAFLAGTILHSADRHVAFYAFAWIASLLTLVSISCVASLLYPGTTRLLHRVEPKVLLTRWIERDVPVPSKAEMFRELAMHFGEWQEQNQKPLRRVRGLYFASVVAGSLALLSWAVLAWVAG